MKYQLTLTEAQAVILRDLVQDKMAPLIHTIMHSNNPDPAMIKETEELDRIHDDLLDIAGLPETNPIILTPEQIEKAWIAYRDDYNDGESDWSSMGSAVQAIQEELGDVDDDDVVDVLEPILHQKWKEFINE